MNTMNSKIEEAVIILEELSVFDPVFTPSRKERLALTLLAVAHIREKDHWKDARYWGDKVQPPWSCTTREIITFWNENYNLNISSGSYDDVRRKNLVYLIEASLVTKSVSNPDSSTNNPTRDYALNQEAGKLIQSFNTKQWQKKKTQFLEKYGKLEGKLEKTRNLEKIPVQLPNGKSLTFTPGEHNQIQKAIVEDFLPRFLKKPQLLYIGDTNDKYLYIDYEALSNLKLPTPEHDTLPDIIAIDNINKWIFFIEAVHSSNPISKIRHLELERLGSTAIHPIVFVSAFLDRISFRKWVTEISWETEVWLSDSPDHMIHFNGDKFLGPHK